MMLTPTCYYHDAHYTTYTKTGLYRVCFFFFFELLRWDSLLPEVGRRKAEEKGRGNAAVRQRLVVVVVVMVLWVWT